MKKIIFFINLFSLSFLPACLDENSPNYLNVEGAIKDGASLEAAVIGLYSALKRFVFPLDF